MNCPSCGHVDVKVVDSRDTDGGTTVRRRRMCVKCSYRFTTYERMEELDIVVIKRDGREQEYDRTKIERGLVRAFQKRPNAHAKIERVLANIEHVLKNKKQRKVKSREVGRIILQELRRSDQVAYVRFASVYKSFGSAESFRKEIEKILE